MLDDERTCASKALSLIPLKSQAQGEPSNEDMKNSKGNRLPLQPGPGGTPGLCTQEAGSLQAGSGQSPRLASRPRQAWTSSLHLAAPASWAETALRPCSSVFLADGWAEDAGSRDRDLWPSLGPSALSASSCCSERPGRAGPQRRLSLALPQAGDSGRGLAASISTPSVGVDHWKV